MSWRACSDSTDQVGNGVERAGYKPATRLITVAAVLDDRSLDSRQRVRHDVEHHNINRSLDSIRAARWKAGAAVNALGPHAGSETNMAPKRIPEVFTEESVKELGEALNRGTEELNDHLRTFQKRLIALNLGVSAYVDIATEEEKTAKLMRRLWFRRCTDNEWRLVVRYRKEGETFDQEKELPLTECNRQTRRKAAFHLEALINEIFSFAQDEREQIEAAAKQASRVSNMLPLAGDDDIPF